MANMIKTIQTNKVAQIILFFAYVLVTTAALAFSQKSVIAFLLLLLSLLLLYYMNLGNKMKWGIALLILVIVLPVSASQGPSYQAYMEVATMVGIYVCMALGLNIVVGLAGLLDLGFVAFFAVGAYTYGVFATAQANNFMPFGTYPLSGNSFWFFIIIGLFVAALFGVLLGIPVLRVKGDYLAIVTLGFGEIIRIVFNNLDKPVNITNGAMGLPSIQQPELFGITLSQPNQFYYIVLVMFIIVIYAVTRMEHTKLGRSWKAVRENEIAAQAMGIPLVKTKLTAFAIGASFSGMMGVVFAAKQMFVDPTSFTYLESTTILVMVILGGMGSVPGVILGAAVVTILNLQVLTELTGWLSQVTTIPDALSPAKMQRFIFGALLIIMTLYRPQGLIPAKNKKVNVKKLKESITEKQESTILLKEGHK
ncbi:branched-chain amino acid ABC transporter permease [Niallia circulans]|jgi:branched-chain amino acid transport system permease protein|uniref:Branched-chain amino acid ABC transporter permease n=1 Tax=Niallia circulans TaxID=1397 RepID=A0A0J1HYV6_NIACI|nr:branched-chain amino acid ABC transporter permease [Niallia circulans]KLV18897.1 branched-chain amino acid ABC transporter permease [Niallia circulans]MDR4316965.1 branched-chain amino acid ABC transporter permease [Niallia circulans]MED3837943.1 branched-chain amino acid ABC transporter permease [Niallia circulans]MED4241726.1 branched-chain amino acid ABC transporter permease [Niallia circulans]MED4247359.1 branched-chain amino acid ABC transporter permease [Niallia circulans]